MCLNFFLFFKNEVLAESKSMVPDTVRRLKTAYAELSDLLVRLKLSLMVHFDHERYFFFCQEERVHQDI